MDLEESASAASPLTSLESAMMLEPTMVLEPTVVLEPTMMLKPTVMPTTMMPTTAAPATTPEISSSALMVPVAPGPLAKAVVVRRPAPSAAAGGPAEPPVAAEAGPMFRPSVALVQARGVGVRRDARGVAGALADAGGVDALREAARVNCHDAEVAAGGGCGVDGGGERARCVEEGQEQDVGRELHFCDCTGECG